MSPQQQYQLGCRSSREAATIFRSTTPWRVPQTDMTGDVGLVGDEFHQAPAVGLLLDAHSGSAYVHAVVTAFVRAAA